MYQHKQSRKNYKITVEFINGYLTSVAKRKDSLNRYLSHDFYFIEIPKKNKVLKDVVVSKIEKTLETFYKQNASWNYDKKLYDNQFKNNMELQLQNNWKESIKSNSETWLGLHSHDIKTELPDKDCFIGNFTEIIEDFFGIDKFEMFMITGDVINDLYHHWGGVGYQDFIFETNQNVYILHFDYTD